MATTSHISVTDQFCGAGGSSQGVRNYAQRSGLATGLEVRLAMNHWKLALETHNTNFPDADHVATDISACNPKDFPSTTILVTSPECFPAGTLILTDRGNIQIEEVRVGDRVLTHMNRWAPVTSLMRNVAATVVVQGQGHPGLECTAAHPFYVRKQTRPWNNDLRRGVRHIAEPEWMEAGKLADQDVRWATPLEVPSLDIPAVGGRGATMNADFWWFVGRWLADGVVTKKSKGKEVIIACGRVKVPETAELLARVLPWRHRSLRTADLFTASHNSLCEWLVQHFGKLAHGKTLPAWSFGMKQEWRQALLEGYLSGDGHVGIRRTQCTTVSKRLAIGIRLLATSLGYHATIGHYEQHSDTIEGRKVNTRPVWMVTWENNRSQRTGWHDDRHAWSLVKQVKPGRSLVQVYCLSVAQDESFIADGIVVHNCVNHSIAKGRKQVKSQLDAFASGKADPAAERSRATMWDVVRFAEYHKYKIVITENVVDARAWELWDPWLMAMHTLGYQHQCVFFNSMFAWPTPQSRDRMYVVFWKKGQRKPNLDFRPWAPCPQCGPVQAIQSFKAKASVKAKYGTQYVYVCPSCAKQVMPFYYAAINAIDWAVPAVRIGDRKKPLEPRTMQRIEYGLKKYGNKPLSVSTLYGERLGCRVKDASESPLFGQHSVNATAIAMPYLVDNGHSHAGDKRARSADAPLRTQAAQDGVGLVTPFLVGTEYDDTKRVRGVDDALAAQTGRATAGVVLSGVEAPFFMDSSFTKAKGEYMNSADEPIGTQTTTESKSVVIPPALMMSLNYPEQAPKGVGEAMDTQTSSRPMALAFLAKLRGTDDSHVKSTTSGMDEPVGTIIAGGLHHALISGRAMSFLESHYSSGENVRGLDDAMGALSCRDRHGLVHGPTPPVRVEDLYFRMLKHHEVQAGMAFARNYVVLGNSREKVKQLGNAVTPPVMEMLIERCVESLM